MSIPRVILHNGTSLDGRMDWGIGDIGLYYELAARWEADAMLSGSNTMLAAYSNQAVPDGDQQFSGSLTEQEFNEGDQRPILAVIDSRGRISNWIQIRHEPYWKDVIILCSQSTPKNYIDGLQRKGFTYVIAGKDRVDLKSALEALNERFGIKVLRVDSGGVLNGALLRSGLVDEVSLIINPCLVGGTSPNSIYIASDLQTQEGVIPLRLIHFKQLNREAVWLLYEVIR